MMAWNDRFTVGGSSDEMGEGDKGIYKLIVLKPLTKLVCFPVMKILEGMKIPGFTHTHAWILHISTIFFC